MTLRPEQAFLKKHLSKDVQKIAAAFVLAGEITKEKDYFVIYGMMMTCLERLFIDGKIILKKTEGEKNELPQKPKDFK